MSSGFDGVIARRLKKLNQSEYFSHLILTRLTAGETAILVDFFGAIPGPILDPVFPVIVETVFDLVRETAADIVGAVDS